MEGLIQYLERRIKELEQHLSENDGYELEVEGRFAESKDILKRVKRIVNQDNGANHNDK